MKVLTKKLKNSNKALVILYFIVLVGYIISLGFLTKSLLDLKGIETFLRILAIVLFYLLWIIYGLCTLMFLCSKKIIKAAVFTLFMAIFIPIFIFGSYFINTTYNSLSQMTREKVVYSSNLIVLKNTVIDEDSKLGMITDDEDIEGSILAKKIIEKESLNNEIVPYDDYYEMVKALYDKEIDGVFVTSNYAVVFSNYESFENIDSEVKVIYEYSEERENVDLAISTNKSLTEPFTILLLGVDSMADGLNPNQAFNGDTLMLLTFNPKTLNATVFSIPRDTYVPIACNNNRYAKINSSAARGTSCVINTIEAFTDIKIDYYVKINFKGVVSLVDALGGITIESPKAFCEQNSNRQFGSNLICIKEGVQDVDGEGALAFARNRHAFTSGDIARIQHQQQVVEQIARKAKDIRSFSEFEKILKAIQKNIETNMSTDRILSLYNVGKDILFKADKNNEGFINIEKTYLEYYSMNIPGYAALGYYQESLDEIIQAMKVNLELEEAKLIKTFSYSYDEAYELRPLGKGLKGGYKLETLINFVGKTKTESTTWCNNRNIKVYYADVVKGDALYNSFYPDGTVVGQNIKSGISLNDVSSITLYVIKNPIYIPPENDNPNNNNDSNDDENKNENPEDETCDPEINIDCGNNPIAPLE